MSGTGTYPKVWSFRLIIEGHTDSAKKDSNFGYGYGNMTKVS